MSDEKQIMSLNKLPINTGFNLNTGFTNFFNSNPIQIQMPFASWFNDIPFVMQGIFMKQFSVPSVQLSASSFNTNINLSNLNSSPKINDFNASTPLFTNNTFNSTVGFDTFNFSLSNPKKKKSVNIGNGTHCYASWDKDYALKQAEKDPNLERLTKGSGWSICSGSFINDIPYARVGTSALLDKVCKEAGVTLTVTSALGTKKSPHDKGDSSVSHYNENNPKLDFGGGLSESEANEIKKKLDKTGLFSRVAVENDGGTCHLDVQFKDSAYATV